MPILPIGSTLTIGGTTLFVSEVKKSFVNEYFDRIEFQYARLRTSPNAAGQRPILTTLLGNTPAQIVIGSISFQDVVPLGPDVTAVADTGYTSNFGNIKKRFDIVRYEISGSPTDAASIATVFTLAESHIKLLARFQSYLDKSASMETSYKELKALQLETFSYLTGTGVSLIGNSVSGTVSNVLITGFQPDVVYEVPTDNSGGFQMLQGFTLTVDQRTIANKDA